jgi:uncharacterized repeat protein (TIGR03803 family)
VKSIHVGVAASLAAAFVMSIFAQSAQAQTYKETVLYSFCAQKTCADGLNPSAGVIFDTEGNLYGTTNFGGSANAGVVFKLTPEGAETVLHSFCFQGGCADGNEPESGLIFDAMGNLYGTTYYGGGTANAGVVFKLTPAGQETVLYSFCPKEGCADGWNPSAGVIFDLDGNLYGTTPFGGSEGDGVVFKLTPAGEESVLYSFCAQIFNYCADGALPSAGMIFDSKGNLYGTTAAGGSANSDGLEGVVFKLTPAREETVLYSFCPKEGCADGANPYAGAIFDSEGNLYETTYHGGSTNSGVVFKITPDGKETVLYSFCAQEKCADGANPHAGVVFDEKGNLYGTTIAGGSANDGIVFKLTP